MSEYVCSVCGGTGHTANDADRPWWCHKIERLSGSSDPKAVGLVRELAEELHVTGLLSDHHDPSDTTGWNVHGIETCKYPLCVAALALTEAKPSDPED